MKTIISAMITVLAVGILSSPVMGQDDCDSVLRFGIWDTLDTHESTSTTQQIANWACSASSRSGSGNYSYGQPKIDLSGSSGSNDCSSNQQGYALSHATALKIQAASPVIVNAWSTCMSRFGSYASIRYREDPAQFTIYLETNSGHTIHGQANITSLQDFNCTIPRSTLRNFQYEHYQAISCTRPNATQATTIDVNYPDGWKAQSLYIPAFLPSAPKPQRGKEITIYGDQVVQITGLEIKLPQAYSFYNDGPATVRIYSNNAPCTVRVAPNDTINLLINAGPTNVNIDQKDSSARVLL